jgi:hypothetical protein
MSYTEFTKSKVLQPFKAGPQKFYEEQAAGRSG